MISWLDVDEKKCGVVLSCSRSILIGLLTNLEATNENLRHCQGYNMPCTKLQQEVFRSYPPSVGFGRGIGVYTIGASAEPEVRATCTHPVDVFVQPKHSSNGSWSSLSFDAGRDISRVLEALISSER